MGNCEYGCKNGKIFMESLHSFVDCPKCGTSEARLSKVTASGVTVLDSLMIPDDYKDIKGIDLKVLFKSIGNADGSSVKKVIKFLEQVESGIFNQELHKQSGYVYVPSFIDIDEYVYSTQTLAIEKGFKVSPYIDLNTLNAIRRAADFRLKDMTQVDLFNEEYKASPEVIDAVDGVKVINRTKLTYDDFVNADICFLRASAATQERGWTVLADIIDLRARNNKPTVVFGYWSSKNPQAGGLRYLIARDGERAKLKRLIPFEVAFSSGQAKTSFSNKVDLSQYK